MPQCAVPGCNNRSTNKSQQQLDEERKNAKIGFHLFPKDPVRRKAWIQASERYDIDDSAIVSVCTSHFPEDAFDRTSVNCVRLRSDAVPSIFPKRLPSRRPRRIIKRRITTKETLNDIENIQLAESPLPVTHESEIAAKSMMSTKSTQCLLGEPLEQKIFTSRSSIRKILVMQHTQTIHKKMPDFEQIVKQLKDKKLLNDNEDCIVILNPVSNVELGSDVISLDDEPETGGLHSAEKVPEPNLSISEHAAMMASEQKENRGIKTRDDETSHSADNSLQFIRTKLIDFRNRMRSLERRNNRLERCVTCIKEALTDLRRENILSVLAETTLQEKITECLEDKPQPASCKQHSLELDDGSKEYGTELRDSEELDMLPRKGHVYECDNCGKNFSLKSTLKKHMKTHVENLLCKCTECHEKILQHKLKSHMKTHITERPFECDVCHKRFPYKGSLKLHVRTHTGERPYQCDKCHKSFASSGTLREHLRRHRGERCYKCNECDKAFVSLTDLKQHLKIHLTVGPYKCNICDKSFHRRDHLKIHIRRHTGERPYVCAVCQKGFPSLTGLQTHSKKHTGERPYMCEKCGKTFVTSSILKVHMRMHIGEDVNIQGREKIHNGIRSYECDTCHKLFTQLGSLKAHLRLHAHERPYECNVCFKRFASKGNFKKHIIVHTGEKPYKCDVCNKAYNQSSTLKIHIRSHTGERPCKCSICGKAFADLGTQRKHEKRHSKGLTDIENIPLENVYYTDTWEVEISTSQPEDVVPSYD